MVRERRGEIDIGREREGNGSGLGEGREGGIRERMGLDDKDVEGE